MGIFVTGRGGLILVFCVVMMYRDNGKIVTLLKIYWRNLKGKNYRKEQVLVIYSNKHLKDLLRKKEEKQLKNLYAKSNFVESDLNIIFT
jgi:hypothetical protein